MFVKLRAERKLRARSAFKLEEINSKRKFLKSNSKIIDLGAAPGGWSQIAVQLTRNAKSLTVRPLPKPSIVSIDLKSIEPLDGCYIIKDDFTFIEAQEKITSFFDNSKVDVVMSDMAPERTGLLTTDHYRQINLCYTALDFATRMLVEGNQSVFLCKVYQGPDEQEFRQEVKKYFKKLAHHKPKASRKTSREYYLFAQGFKGRI